MKTQHTPGPWRTNAKFEPYQETATVYANTRKICECRESVCFTAEDVANAHLIAAAPELLAALENLAYWSDRINALQHAGNPILPSSWSELYSATNAARSAITKASVTP